MGIMVTIVTPSYNRAGKLPALFQSLCAQTCKDFVWLVIDDGSKDGTRNLVESYVKGSNAGFPIRYVYKENGGLFEPSRLNCSLSWTVMMY